MRLRHDRSAGLCRFRGPATLVVLLACALAWTPGPARATIRYSTEEGWSYRAPRRPEGMRGKRTMRRTAAEQYAYGKGFADRGRYTMAIFQWRSLLSHTKRNHYTPGRYQGKAQLGIADAYLAAGNLTRAADEYNTALVEYSRFFTGREIARARENLLAVGDYFYNLQPGRWRDAVGMSHWERAAEIYTYYIINAPYSAQAPRVQYLIGEAFFRREDYINASEEYRRVIDNHPGSEWRDDAQFQLGVAYQKRTRPAIYDQTLTDSGLEAFRTFVHDYPDDARVPDAMASIRTMEELKAESLYIIARWYRRQRQWEGARLYYRELVDNFPTTQWAAIAEEQLEGLQ